MDFYICSAWRASFARANDSRIQKGGITMVTSAFPPPRSSQPKNPDPEPTLDVGVAVPEIELIVPETDQPDWAATAITIALFVAILVLLFSEH